ANGPALLGRDGAVGVAESGVPRLADAAAVGHAGNQNAAAADSTSAAGTTPARAVAARASYAVAGVDGDGRCAATRWARGRDGQRNRRPKNALEKTAKGRDSHADLVPPNEARRTPAPQMPLLTAQSASSAR